jgi:predicted enzyme related to lactoylglutathione lyase
VFRWQSPENPSGIGTTAWCVFESDTTYFGPAAPQFMLNFRVADLHGLLALLRAEGCKVEDKTDESELGKFGWVTDPEGNRVELWEPPEGR